VKGSLAQLQLLLLRLLVKSKLGLPDRLVHLRNVLLLLLPGHLVQVFLLLLRSCFNQLSPLLQLGVKALCVRGPLVLDGFWIRYAIDGTLSSTPILRCTHWRLRNCRK